MTTADFTQVQTSPPIVRSNEAIMDALEDITFGSIAGVAGKYIEYPFDTIKVRLQSQPSHLPPLYIGPLDAFTQAIRSDGPLSLYRGISAPLIGAALETSSLFFWERVAREGLFKSNLYSRETPLPLSALWLTGAISGAFTSLVLTPVELVKCKIQVNPSSTNSVTWKAPTPIEVIKEVYHHQGIRGFWNGQLGTLIRETGGCAAWFGSKETCTLLFRHFNKPASSRPSSFLTQEQNPVALPLYQQALAGASAGMAYNFLFYPADTIKSRMQTVDTHCKKAKTKFWAEGAGIYRQYGVRGLYRGCGITVLRSAPSSAFIFIVFDALKVWSQAK